MVYIVLAMFTETLEHRASLTIEAPSGPEAIEAARALDKRGNVHFDEISSGTSDTTYELERGPWSVMLMPPDTIRPHCTIPFLCHVTAADRSGAFDAAIVQANREFMIGEAEAAEMQPSDWLLLLLCEGHVVNLVEGG